MKLGRGQVPGFRYFAAYQSDHRGSQTLAGAHGSAAGASRTPHQIEARGARHLTTCLTVNEGRPEAHYRDSQVHAAPATGLVAPLSLARGRGWGWGPPLPRVLPSETP